MGRILALDYGEKRIGVAISDETKTIAFPKSHLNTQDFEKLLDFISKSDIEEVIVGYPVALSGKETASTERAKTFSEKLKGVVDVPVWLVDERLSTQEVLAEFRDMGQDLKKHKGMIDSFVAAKMLERYLVKMQN